MRDCSVPPYSNAEFSPHTTSGMWNRTAIFSGIEKIAMCIGIAVEPYFSYAARVNRFSTSGEIE